MRRIEPRPPGRGPPDGPPTPFAAPIGGAELPRGHLDSLSRLHHSARSMLEWLLVAMGIAVGIDLGTAECCVYSVQLGKLVAVPGLDGGTTTAAAVAFDDEGRPEVGARALARALVDPTRAVVGVKRLLGRKFHSPAVTWLREAFPVPLVPARNGDAWLRIGSTDMSPVVVVGVLLEQLRLAAERSLGEEVDEAVISVPACYGQLARRALLDAAVVAGFRAATLLNEPTAAAIAYGHDKPNAQRIALLDLGAGSYDVSIVEYRQQGCEVLVHSGEPLLGADDFDRCIVQRWMDDFHRVEGIDLQTQPVALHRLYRAARSAREQLTGARRSSPIHVAEIAHRGGRPVDLKAPELSREVFDALVVEELARLGDPCAWALEDVGLGTDDMDAVVLAGGATRMPTVRGRIEYLFRRPAVDGPHRATLVARGAALHGAALRGELDAPVVQDVTAQSLGIKIRQGHFNAVIPRASRMPCREQKVLAPAQGSQERLVLEIYEGESDLVQENNYVGRVWLENLEARKAVAVAFDVDQDGLLTLSMTSSATAGERRLPLQLCGGLTARQVAQIVAERLHPTEAAPAEVAPPSSRSWANPTDALDAAATIAARAVSRSVRPAAPAARVARSVPPTGGGTPPLELGADALVGTTLGGRYVVESIIAEGGMGRVYRGRHLVLDKVVAIKVLHTELSNDTDLADRFLREAQAASSIKNDHVIDISDFGRLESGTGYFVMEYLEGGTLADLILMRGPLEPELIRDIALQLSDALAAAHDAQIVHRDLKPENVTLVERGGREFFCKVLDFGIAKRPTSDVKRRLTLAGELLGTPYYMAPEQVDCADVDGRSDIYSLGAVMYEMATGSPPFEADTVVGVLVKHKSEQPESIRSRRSDPDFPAGLEATILRCLAKAPEDRFQSARELAEALSKEARV